MHAASRFVPVDPERAPLFLRDGMDKKKVLTLMYGAEEERRRANWIDGSRVESKWFGGRSRKLLAREKRQAEARAEASGKKRLEREGQLGGAEEEKKEEKEPLEEEELFSAGYADPTPAVYCLQRKRR